MGDVTGCRLSRRLHSISAILPQCRFTAAQLVRRISCRWATSPFSRSSKVGELRPIGRGVTRRAACTRPSIGRRPAAAVVEPSRLRWLQLISLPPTRRCGKTWPSRWPLSRGLSFARPSVAIHTARRLTWILSTEWSCCCRLGDSAQPPVFVC